MAVLGTHGSPLRPLIVAMIAMSSLSSLLAFAMWAPASALSMRMTMRELAAASDLVAVLEIATVPTVTSPGGVVDVPAGVRLLLKSRTPACATQLKIRNVTGLSTRVELPSHATLVAYLAHVEACTFLPIGAAQGIVSVVDGQVHEEGRNVPLDAYLARVRAAIAALESK